MIFGRCGHVFTPSASTALHFLPYFIIVALSILYFGVRLVGRRRNGGVRLRLPRIALALWPREGCILYYIIRTVPRRNSKLQISTRLVGKFASRIKISSALVRKAVFVWRVFPINPAIRYDAVLCM